MLVHYAGKMEGGLLHTMELRWMSEARYRVLLYTFRVAARSRGTSALYSTFDGAMTEAEHGQGS